jgi:hypothetical protein
MSYALYTIYYMLYIIHCTLITVFVLSDLKKGIVKPLQA